MLTTDKEKPRLRFCFVVVVSCFWQAVPTPHASSIDSSAINSVLCYICYLSAASKSVFIRPRVSIWDLREELVIDPTSCDVYTGVLRHQRTHTTGSHARLRSHTHAPVRTHTSRPSSVTDRWIFYMFIHFNSVAGVLLKCWCAAYINPLRQGQRQARTGRPLPLVLSRRLSSIIICSSAAVCLLALSLSIPVPGARPAPCCTSCSPPPILSVRIHTYMLSRVPYAFSLSHKSYLEDERCLSVSFSLCFWAWRSGQSLTLATELSKNFRSPVWTVRGNWEDIEEVMNPCTRLSADRQLLPPGLQSEGGMYRGGDIVGMDGSQLERRLWAVTLVKTGTGGWAEWWPRTKTLRAWAHICLCTACLCLYPYGCRWGKERSDIGWSTAERQIMTENPCIQHYVWVCVWEREMEGRVKPDRPYQAVLFQ